MGFFATEMTSPRAGAYQPPKTLRGPILLQESGQRHYSPGLGRWISRDPIGEAASRNVYLFTLNRPAMLVDLLGLRNIAFPGVPPGTDPRDEIGIPAWRGFPSDDPTCNAEHAGATKWARRKYGKAEFCNENYDLAEWTYYETSLGIGNWRDARTWQMPPSYIMYSVWGKISWDFVTYREVTERLYECNCHWGRWKWRKAKNADGHSKRSMHVQVERMSFWTGRSESFATFDLGEIGEHPDPHDTMDYYVAKWEEEVDDLNTFSPRCPEFDVWGYR